MDNLATSLKLFIGRDETGENHRRALVICKRVFGQSHPDTLVCKLRLASTLHQQKLCDEAENILRDVLASGKEVWGDNHPTILDTRFQIGNVLSDQGKREEAESIFGQIVDDAKRDRGIHDSLRLIMVHMFTPLLRSRSQWDEASTLLEKAVLNAQTNSGPSHPDVVLCREGLTNLRNKLDTEGQHLFEPEEDESHLEEHGMGTGKEDVLFDSTGRPAIQGDPIDAPQWSQKRRQHDEQNQTRTHRMKKKRRSVTRNQKK